MSNTPKLSLPLVAPSQAQKHVTVNEAFARLDALVKLSVRACDLVTPPADPVEGDAYVVGSGATGDWLGQETHIAYRSNGHWTFFVPRAGWQAWDMGSFSLLTFDGVQWRSGVISTTANGNVTQSRIIEFEHVDTPGWSNATATTIPKNATVIGVTGRVLQNIVGEGTTSWKLGIEGLNQQFGSDLGLTINSYVHGVLSSPLTYYAPTALRLGAVSGAFISGKVRLGIHILELSIPRSF